MRISLQKRHSEVTIPSYVLLLFNNNSEVLFRYIIDESAAELIYLRVTGESKDYSGEWDVQ